MTGMKKKQLALSAWIRFNATEFTGSSDIRLGEARRVRSTIRSAFSGRAGAGLRDATRVRRRRGW